MKRIHLICVSIAFLLTGPTFINAIPGAPCANNSTCQLSHSYLFCKIQQFETNGTCECLPYMVWNENQSSCQVSANNHCGINPNCVPFATCVGNICQCDSGYLAENTLDAMCFPSFHTECHASNPCSYDAGLYCAPIIDPSTPPMDFSIETSVDPDLGSSSGPDESTTPLPPGYGRCECGSDFSYNKIWSERRENCLLPASGPFCLTDEQCIDNAACSTTTSVCTCMTGYTITKNNTCLRDYDQLCHANDPCNSDKQFQCSSFRKCECQPNSVYDVSIGECRKLTGEDCLSNVECYRSSQCHPTHFKCYCSFGYAEASNRTCEPEGRDHGNLCDAQDGNSCDLTKHLGCNQTSSRCECVDSVWEPASIASGAYCGITAEGSCGNADDFNLNCVRNAECILSVCTCKPGSIKTSEGHCRKSFNEPCSDSPSESTPNGPCSNTAGLKCIANKCICQDSSEWSPEHLECVPLISGDCSGPVNRCVNNAACNDRGFCECNAGFLTSTDRRQCLGSINQYCNQTQGCGGGLACTSGLCSCAFPVQQIFDPNLGICVGISGALCDNISLKCGEFSLCKEGTDDVSRCVCNEGYRENPTSKICELICPPEQEWPETSGKCLNLVPTDCSAAGATCIENASCNNEFQYCECNAGYLATASGHCLASHNQVCSIGSPCNEERLLVCGTNFRCECKYPNQQQYDSDLGYCVSISGGLCDSTMKCGKFSECRLGVDGVSKCVCNEGYTPNNGNCQLMCPSGQEWSTEFSVCLALVSGDCSVTGCIDNAVCNSHKYCQCNENYLSTTDRHCLKSHNQACNAAVPCNGERFLVCGANSICRCKYPDQQKFDEGLGYCVSILGGYCGDLDENGVMMTCGENLACEPEPLSRSRCGCAPEFTLTGEQTCVFNSSFNINPFSFIYILLLGFLPILTYQ